MNVSVGSTAESMELKQAILLYNTFATVHPVAIDKANRPVIQPGKLATKDGLIAALRAMLPETERGTGLLPGNILATGIDHMMWWIKPTQRAVWFSCAEVGGERSANVPHPGLVMLWCKSGWYVFAFKGTDRPQPDTKLYQVPYFNVWQGGKICTGSVRTPRGAKRKEPKAWEDAFFGSFFTHPNIHQPGQLIARGNVYKFWISMLEGKYRKFPESLLVDTGKTVQTAYDTLVLRG